MAETSETTANRTIWTSDIGRPFRHFLRTESGSAGILVATIVAALIWCNLDPHSYESVWSTHLSVQLGEWGLHLDLHEWVNGGLMTFFFLVVGLEARREFDLGDLRERKRFVLPCVAGLVGMLVPAAIYLAFNAGGEGAHGWAVVMSTDTALALGLLTIVGRNIPDRVRVFLLTVFVVDDFVALAIIALVYSDEIMLWPLALSIVSLAVFVGAQKLGLHSRAVYAFIALVAWVGMLESGVDPVVVGLLIGLTASAYTPSREDLENATGLVRLFREQPTAELARSARSGLSRTLSPNARLQNTFHPWAGYVIVPLFGLANAGIELSGKFLADAFTSPVTLGIIAGFVVGKPVGVFATSWIISRMTKQRLRPPVGWAGVLGSGTLAGIGFTVSFLIASLAFDDPQLLNEAKFGVLVAAALASLITWSVFRATAMMAPARKARLLLGESEEIVDLGEPVDVERDHIRGPLEASVTVVEYGDFQCPYCGPAEPAVRELLDDEDIRYVWRHLPLMDVHPDAQKAAEAAEAAGVQGKFWEMHDLLLTRQENLHPTELVQYAEQLGLDVEQFKSDLKKHVHRDRIAQDLESADFSGVSGTPTFFVNGRRHYGAFDIETLTRAIRTARARTLFGDRD
jgi:Na+/H+ antiporter NhaA